MIILDAGALIGIEKGNARAVALVDEAVNARLPVRVPASVLAQVWRNSPRQHPIGRLLGAGSVEIIDLDRRHAQAVGALLAGSGTADVVDAHVIVCARLTRARAVITSDPDDLRALDPNIRLEVV
ncbi:PIN domain-containing protein [Nocardia pseudovaccinii]|uniref:PIN domain-containing protein n=1 Tax=Nocardia pseudovaccinii TaxID=189540 RepID=UPI0007A3F8A7|nr:PIN domain-containing protein [Nocardia pseudovaccinii]